MKRIIPLETEFDKGYWSMIAVAASNGLDLHPLLLRIKWNDHPLAKLSRC